MRSSVNTSATCPFFSNASVLLLSFCNEIQTCFQLYRCMSIATCCKLIRFCPLSLIIPSKKLTYKELKTNKHTAKKEQQQGQEQQPKTKQLIHIYHREGNHIYFWTIIIGQVVPSNKVFFNNISFRAHFSFPSLPPALLLVVFIFATTCLLHSFVRQEKVPSKFLYGNQRKRNYMYEELNCNQISGLCTCMTRVGSGDWLHLELTDVLTSMTFDNWKY